MQGLSIGGRGKVAVNLDIPFKSELGEKRVNGRVDLSGADMASTQWGIEFSAASGRVEFSDEGFLASELRVGYREQPASLSIAVGGLTSSPDLAVEAALRGRFDVDGLLAGVLHHRDKHLEVSRRGGEGPAVVASEKALDHEEPGGKTLARQVADGVDALHQVLATSGIQYLGG